MLLYVTETDGLLGTRAKGGHLDFHTAPELCLCSTCRLLLQQDHDGQVSFSGPQGSVRCKRSLDVSLWLYHYHCISQVVGYLLVSHRGYRMMGLRLHITGSLPPPSRAISDHGDYLKIQSPYDQLLLLIAFLYSAILRSRADSVRSHVIQHEWLAFYSAFFFFTNISTEVVYLQHWHGWCHVKLLPSRRVLCTPYKHAPCHFMQIHIRKVHAYLAVTYHPHFWQNDRDHLRASAVTRGWTGYRNKSQHRKLTPEKKILPPLQQGFELTVTTFWSRVRRSNHWAIPTAALSKVVIQSQPLSFFLFFSF